jgi:hypothetical protein
METIPDSQHKAGIVLAGLAVIASVMLITIIAVAFHRPDDNGQTGRAGGTRPTPPTAPKDYSSDSGTGEKPPTPLAEKGPPTTASTIPTALTGESGPDERSNKLLESPERDRKLKAVDDKEIAVEQNFESLKHELRERFTKIKLPSAGGALAAELRAELTRRINTGESLRVQGGYMTYHTWSYGLDRGAIESAAAALGQGADYWAKVGEAKKDLYVLSLEIREASLKHAHAMLKLEQERRGIKKNYPMEGDPKFTSYKGLLVTEDELQQIKSHEKAHKSARAAADSHVLLLDRLKAWTPTYKRTYTHQYQDNIVAVVYSTEKPSERQVYVLVYRNGDGLWFVVPNEGRPDGLHRGSQPPIFRATD